MSKPPEPSSRISSRGDPWKKVRAKLQAKDAALGQCLDVLDCVRCFCNGIATQACFCDWAAEEKCARCRAAMHAAACEAMLAVCKDAMKLTTPTEKHP